VIVATFSESPAFFEGDARERKRGAVMMSERERRAVVMSERGGGDYNSKERDRQW
jgi:hypothetical protein